MVTRVEEFDRVMITDLHRCLRNLRDQMLTLQIESYSLPMINRGRCRKDLRKDCRDLYSMTDLIFHGTDITMYLHDRYFLSITQLQSDITGIDSLLLIYSIELDCLDSQIHPFYLAISIAKTQVKDLLLST